MNQQTDLVAFVHQQEQNFLPVLSDEKITWAKESQFAIQALQKNDYLQKISKSNLASLQNAIINVAAVGITLNPATKHAYLVPRDGMVCLDISYMGLLHIAQQSGSILWGQCKLVYKNDKYVNQGLAKEPLHEYQSFGDRGEVVGGYCTVKTCDGDFLTEEMSVEEINAIRDRSPSWKRNQKGPWKTDWSEMARKTIVKRGSKYWPNVERLDKAIHYLNEEAGEGIVLENDQNDDVLLCGEELDQRITSLLMERGTDADAFFKWVSKHVKRDIVGLNNMTDDEKQRLLKKMEASK